MANIDINTGLCPGGRVRMERLASLVEYGRIKTRITYNSQIQRT